MLLLFVVVNTANSQIDTTGIRQDVNSLKNIEAHSHFWEDVYVTDQQYRGKSTNDSIDKLNLIKCCIYLNRFGYPDRELVGRKSSIISLVWIHNKFPQVDLLTFPIIAEGYRTNQIDENEYRNYYIRSIYMRQFSDDGYKDLPLDELIRKVKPKISTPINIHDVLKAFEEQESFLRIDHHQIGSWKAPIVYDTAFYNGKPIVHNITRASINIFMDDESQYYIYPKYDDRSGFPQKLTQISNDPLRFKIFDEDESFMEINSQGNLLLIEPDKVIIIYSPEETK